MIRFNIVVLCSLFLSGCGTFGKDAIKLMDEVELEVLNQLRSYSIQTTEQDISKNFGPPIKGAGTIRPSWEVVSGEQPKRVQAYFITGGLNKVHFLSLDPLWGYVIHYNSDGTILEME